MKSDIEIARETPLKPIKDIALGLGIAEESIEPYGRYIAKLPLELINEEKIAKSKLILVTAITPTKAGIGKTTVSVGLALGMNRIGKQTMVALREPSLGPCFGMKGGAAGGGYAQVLPMDKINLHFTGDFHAITSAHNMIAALLDNYIYQHQAEGFAMREVLWKRVLDVNDRNLRYIVTGLGAKTNGVTGESGFDITPASEIMAILCLAQDEDDLRRRIENILLGIGKGKKLNEHASCRLTGKVRIYKHSESAKSRSLLAYSEILSDILSNFTADKLDVSVIRNLVADILHNGKNTVPDNTRNVKLSITSFGKVCIRI